MHAGPDEPDDDQRDDRPEDQRAVRPSGKSATASAEAHPTAAKKLVDRRDGAPAEAAPAPGGFSPWTAAVAVVGRRLVAAAGWAPRPLIVGEKTANAAGPPQECAHRQRI